jgi:6-phosphogluconolactonase
MAEINTSDTTGTIVLGQSPDDPARIEAELSRLWSDIAAAESDRASFSRVCLANLIVVGQPGEQQALDLFSTAVASAYPCRVIHASLDSDASVMTASVSAACQKTVSGDSVVCWEKIALRVPSGCDDSLASAVRALMVGRIATIVVLAVPGVEWPELLSRAHGWADLLITDRACLTVASRFLFWDRHGGRQARVNWMSLCWESLTTTRRAIAEAFDDPRFRDALEQADSIECIGHRAPDCEMLLGWIVSRLNWVIVGPDRDGGVLVRREAAGNRVRITPISGEGLALRLSQGGRAMQTLSLGEDGRSPARFEWDDPAWAGRVIEASHRETPDRVFLEAADAAVKVDGVMKGSMRRSRVTVVRDGAAMAGEAATHFAALANAAVAERGRFLVALAGGGTPEALYRRLAEAEHRRRIPWESIEWFWGDERWVPHDHADSNYGMVRRSLLDHVPVNADHIHPIPTDADSPDIAAEAYESLIRNVTGVRFGAAPRFDLILLGIGVEGHTASWFPGSPLDALDQRLVWGGYVAKVGAHRVSLTPQTINAARHIVFLASGEGKADIVAKTFYPDWRNRHPAACVEPDAGDIAWFLDQSAARGIEAADFERVGHS